jgi:hypothetical protein
MTLRHLACSAIVCLACAAACVSSVPKTTSLRVVAAQGAPPAARVTIDDQPVGSLKLVAERGVALPPGKHRVTIEAEGYLPWDAEVDAGGGGGLVKLDVVLVKIPD